ncbi:unnamed protein product [Protopolystoma xenopodis]|uniref:Uncharacterized protein n=1 Tax=Protopolystoma xenopodis TaxID=117903 RepID=A0A448X0M0_9PLAT|nr:unnamed protein product [Protopolystoma xenopodis]
MLARVCQVGEAEGTDNCCHEATESCDACLHVGEATILGLIGPRERTNFASAAPTNGKHQPLSRTAPTELGEQTRRKTTVCHISRKLCKAIAGSQLKAGLQQIEGCRIGRHLHTLTRAARRLGSSGRLVPFPLLAKWTNRPVNRPILCSNAKLHSFRIDSNILLTMI